MKKFIAVTQSVGWAIGWTIFTALFVGWDTAAAVRLFAQGNVGLAWLNLGIGILMGVFTAFWVHELRRRYAHIALNAYLLGRSGYVVPGADK